MLDVHLSNKVTEMAAGRLSNEAVDAAASRRANLSPSQGNNVLSIRQISFKTRGKEILKGISMEVRLLCCSILHISQ